MALITGAASPSIALAALAFPRKYQIRTSVSNCMPSTPSQGSNMERDVDQIMPICPHAESRMMDRPPPRLIRRNTPRGHQHRPLLAAIEDGHALVAIEGTEHLGHATAEIEDGGLHGHAPSVHMKCV